MRLIIAAALVFLSGTWATAQSEPCTSLANCTQLLLERVETAEQDIAALKAENDRLRKDLQTAVSALKTAPGGGSWTGYSMTRGGGANAMSMKRQCPKGQVVIGVELIVGGTCRGTCNADGGALHKFRVLCGPRFN